MNTRRPIILDGGMGQEAIRRMLPNPPTKLWGTQALLDRPDIIQQLHQEYILAGADVITLCSYTCTPQRLARDGAPAPFETLQTIAIEIAHSARATAKTQYGRDVQIAGCLPPLVASYHPDTTPPMEEAIASYQRIVDIQKDHVDILLIETMSGLSEAEAALTAAKTAGCPVWVAFKLDDTAREGVLLDGTPLREAIQLAESFAVDAVLLNCARPETIMPHIPVLQEFSGLTGVYPNVFECTGKLAVGGTVDTLTKRVDFTISDYKNFMSDAFKKGVTILGGCCETTPDHIRALQDMVAQIAKGEI